MKILGGYFDFDNKRQEVEKLEEEVNSPSFWNDRENASSIISKYNSMKEEVLNLSSLLDRINSNIEMIGYPEMNELCMEEYKSISDDFDKFMISCTLNGPYDSKNAIVEIHSGAGGTESCDWVMILARMYERYAMQNGFKYELLSFVPGEEVGYKSISFIIRGKNAYGFLNCEAGVHRLIRISPFDSNARRHTTFASVDVTPEIDNDVIVDVKEDDLKIDVYRSSGAGGQSVNTTDSAVRITHIPTNIVVTCQNERSQIKNKEKALSILKSKLYKMELDAKAKELKQLHGEKVGIDFGSQIRTYTLHPYSLIKDHRTNYEDTNVIKVLDGDIGKFIEAYLKYKISM